MKAAVETRSQVPVGWARDEAGALRRETVHSMLRRLDGWDYRARAIYQITVTLADRARGDLGRLEVRRKASPENGRRDRSPENGREQNGDPLTVVRSCGGLESARAGARSVPSRSRDGSEGGWLAVPAAKGLGLAPDEVEARVVASAYGRAVLDALGEMSRRYPQVAILARQIMPDHVHFVAFVTSPLDRPFGALVRGFKAGAASRWRKLAARAPSPAWAEGFQDTVLLHEGQLDNMVRYLADNPRRLAVKRLFPDLFRVVGELARPLEWDGQRVVGHFAALGNRFLLDRPLVQVQVSRRDFEYRREGKPGGGLKIVRDAAGEPVAAFASPLFAQKKAALLAAAKHGAVLVSPCVSDGERQIAHEVLAAGHGLVTLQNKGFSSRQKPAGKLFDACAEGRLLLLAPAAWPYQPGEKPMTRSDATAMNRLCQGLVGTDAAHINYHGMRPANIDALARAAANCR